MLMNVSTQMCGLLLTATMLIFYYRRKQIYTLSDKMFTKLLLTLLLSIVFDILLVVITNVGIKTGHYSLQNSSFDTDWNVAINFLSKAYSISLAAFTLTACDYTIYDVVKLRRFFPGARIVLFLLMLSCASDVYISNNYVYPSGLCASVTFFISMLALLAMVLYMLTHLSKCNKTKVVCSIIWFVMWVLSFTLQTNYHIYLTSFACALGVFILFYEVENPEAKIDKTTGFFMAHTISECLLAMKKTGLQIHIGVINTRGSRVDYIFIKTKLEDSYHLCFKDTDSFCYILTYDYDVLVDLLTTYCNSNKSVVAIYKNFTDDDISIFLNYVRRNVLSWGSSTVHIITKDDMRNLEDEDSIRLEILNALIEDRISTYVQPIFNVKERKFTSGECLCRLLKKDGSIIPPNRFIPVAERTGLIVDIESAMFRNMCKCLSDDRLLKSDISYLEANLSIKKGERHDLVEEYSAILEEFHIPSHMVNLEITETDVVEQKISILNNMTRMKELGFQFSLDDFGTGESNLGYIIDMPVSIIKFDREITQKAMKDIKAMTVVRNVIGMAHELNMKVVVEGVETEEDVKTCLLIDADYIQGYYFSKPLPMDEFIDFVNKPLVLSSFLESCG